MSARDLKGALRCAHEAMHGAPFGVSVFAAINKVGVGEAVSLLQAGETQGWVDVMAGYYQLSSAGVAACIA